MTEKIKEQIMAIRDSGETNMLDTRMVQYIANREGYTQFITSLCQMASEQTRILNKPYDGDNDRFAMRIFMVRLGMKGAQYALVRKLMMKHLSGNSAWKNGAPPTPPRTAVYMRVGNASQISKPEPEEASE